MSHGTDGSAARQAQHPEPWALAALMPIGRLAHQPKARPHKPLEEVAC